MSELNSIEQTDLTCPQNELRSLDDPTSESTTTTINHQKIMETASENDNNTSDTPVSNESVSILVYFTFEVSKELFLKGTFFARVKNVLKN